MRDLGKTALNCRVCATEDDKFQKDGNISTCYQVVNYPSAKYVTDVVIAEAEAVVAKCETTVVHVFCEIEEGSTLR